MVSGAQARDAASIDRSALLIVLGAPVNADGSPSQALLRRAGWAARLYRQQRDAWLLASGGASSPTQTEASAIAALLQHAGVPVQRILREEQSRNTWENARYCAAIIGQHGFSDLTLVTDPLHMPRARLAFRAFGLRPRACPVCRAERDPSLRTWLSRTLHEALGIVYYLIRLFVTGVRG